MSAREFWAGDRPAYLYGQVAGYARVSMFILGSVSAEAQMEEESAEAKRRGLPEPVWYIDRDRSASDERKPRPEFDRLMADIKAGKILIVIARSSDRFVRRPRELESVIDILSARNVPVFFTRDSDYDLSTAGGRETARIKAAIARGEVERMSERMKSSSAQRARQGVPRKGHKAFGYTFGNKADGTLTYVKVAKQAEAIRWACDYLMKGGTLAGVAREWNTRTLRNGRGNEWDWLGVKQAMLNPALGGFRYYQPVSILTPEGRKRKAPWQCELLPGNWTGILTETEYRALRTVLTSTRSQAGNNKRHLGAAIYRCGVHNDGTTMKSNRRTTGLSYICRESSHLQIPGDKVDEFVREMLRRALTDRKVFDAAFGASAVAVDVEALNEQRKAVQKRLDDLIDSHDEGRIPISVFERSSTRLSRELEDIDNKLADVKEVTQRIVRLTSFEEIDEALSDLDLTQERQLLNDVFTEIWILPVGKGYVFDPMDHVRLTDRTGRVWPTWLKEWEQARSFTRNPALTKREPHGMN
ncbi:recombinase family protein [Catellatospora sichuanensis]|uniref:recombinase family protein n=1 Tax=Catellatospora sichuanensis TaxID=1969805 RepID=UPI001642A67A|nr:recombinase family protein [Catellatospora sichuanensis]